MDEKRSGIVLFLVVVVMVLVLRALKREGESVKREPCSSSRDDDGSRPILIGRERGSIGASAHKRLLPNENSFSRSVCSPKDGRFFIPFLLVDQNPGEKSGRRGFFFSLYERLYSLFLSPSPFPERSATTVHK